MRWWMLHGNVSRKGYGNALIGRYGDCFEEDIRRFMMIERIMPWVWVHRRSMRQLSRSERAMHGTEEASKIWEGGSANNRILALVRRNHALIIVNSLSNREVHKETSTPRRSVWGFGYPCASSIHGT